MFEPSVVMRYMALDGFSNQPNPFAIEHAQPILWRKTDLFGLLEYRISANSSPLGYVLMMASVISEMWADPPSSMTTRNVGGIKSRCVGISALSVRP